MRVLNLIPLLFAISIVHAEEARTLYKFKNNSVGSLLKSEINYGCGCSFSYHPTPQKENAPTILQWEEGEPASFYINGQLHKLSVKTQDNYSEKLGDAITYTLESSAVNIQASLKVSWVCPVSDESCEVTKYDGVLNVKTKTDSVVIPISGDCGC